MRVLLAMAATVSLIGCAHAPAPAAVAVAPAANVDVDVDARTWACSAEGVCRRVETPVDPAHAVVPPMPDVSNDGWTLMAKSEPTPHEKAMAELTPGQKAALGLAAEVLRGLGGK